MIGHPPMQAWARTAVLGTLLGFTGCRFPAKGPDAPPEPPQVTLFGVQMRMFRGADLTMVGRAAKLAYQRQSADMVASEALLRFPSRKTGARSPGNAIAGLEVRAPEVLGNLYTRQAEAHGGVILRTASGMVGETERALFDGNAMKVEGPAPVEITGPGYRLDAQGFHFVFEDETFTFEGETQTVLGAPGGSK